MATLPLTHLKGTPCWGSSCLNKSHQSRQASLAARIHVNCLDLMLIIALPHCHMCVNVCMCSRMHLLPPWMWTELRALSFPTISNSNPQPGPALRSVYTPTSLLHFLVTSSTVPPARICSLLAAQPCLAFLASIHALREQHQHWARPREQKWPTRSTECRTPLTETTRPLGPMRRKGNGCRMSRGLSENFLRNLLDCLSSDWMERQKSTKQ